MFKFTKLLSLLGVKTKEPYRIIKPRLSYRLYCKTTGKVGYGGFELDDGRSTMSESITCSCCKRHYNYRFRNTDVVGKIVCLGSKHTLTITAIKTENTARDF